MSRAHQVSPVGASLPPADLSPRRALLRIALLVAPVSYAGLIVGVLIHEVIGHGGALWLTGGGLDEVLLHPRGAGATFSREEADPVTHAVIALAGPAAEAIWGLAFLAAFLRLRSPGSLRFAVGALALRTLTNGFSQMADAVLLPGLPSGDVATVCRVFDAPWMATAFAVAGATGSAAMVLGPGRLLLRDAESILGEAALCRGTLRAGAVAALLLLPGPAGIGLLPLSWLPSAGAAIAVTLAFHGGLAAVLFASGGRGCETGPRVPAPGAWAIGIAWAAAATAFLVAQFGPWGDDLSAIYR